MTDVLDKLNNLNDSLTICRSKCETQVDIISHMSDALKLTHDCLADIKDGRCKNPPQAAEMVLHQSIELLLEAKRMGDTANDA